MLLTPKHLRAGDFGISVFRSPGKGVPIMMELQADSGVQEEQRACIGIEGPGDQYHKYFRPGKACPLLQEVR